MTASLVFYAYCRTLTQELREPDGLVIMFHSHSARVEEYQDDDEPKPGWGLTPLSDQEPHLLLLAPQLLVEIVLGAAVLRDNARALLRLLLREAHLLQQLHLLLPSCSG